MCSRALYSGHEEDHVEGKQGGVYAVIFSDRQLGVFERYKNDLGFDHSADAEDTVWRG